MEWVARPVQECNLIISTSEQREALLLEDDGKWPSKNGTGRSCVQRNLVLGRTDSQPFYENWVPKDCGQRVSKFKVSECSTCWNFSTAEAS